MERFTRMSGASVEAAAAMGRDARHAPIRRLREQGPEVHWTASGPAMAAGRFSTHESKDVRGVQLCCCDCGRTAGSTTHGAADFCRLIGWSYDAGVAVCVRCQWSRGETPLDTRNLGAAEPASGLRASMVRLRSWWMGPEPSATGRRP